MSTSNRRLVGGTADGKHIAMLNPPRSAELIPREEAIEFAAWILVMANCEPNEIMLALAHVTGENEECDAP